MESVLHFWMDVLNTSTAWGTRCCVWPPRAPLPPPPASPLAHRACAGAGLTAEQVSRVAAVCGVGL